MTRFWLSKHQATQIVFDTLEKMKGGEIFVPILKSCKMIDIVTEFYPVHPVYPVEVFFTFFVAFLFTPFNSRQ